MAEDLVRLFPGYAESVIWYPHPVAYADSGLEADLVAELRAWEESYYAGLDDFEWRSVALERDFAAEGRRLAAQVAGALGDEFLVEVDGHRVRSRHPARSQVAAAAFRAIAAAERTTWEHIDRLVADGAELEWRAEPGGRQNPPAGSGV